MILNVFSISEIFVGILSTVLMIWGGFFSLILYIKEKNATSLEEKNRIENQSYLLFLIAMVVLIIRLLNWPFFYATLHSFIGDIDGAMCIFGVTQVKPHLTKFQEILKPVVFFLIGAWLLTHKLDLATKTSPLMSRKLLFLSLLSIVVIVDSIGDTVLIMSMKPGFLVSCCTTVTDILTRPTRTAPESLFGPGYGQVLQNSYIIFNLILLAALGIVRWGKKWNSITRGTRISLLLIFAVANGFLFVLAQIERLAPKIMGLPYHHCLYCLWQYVPDSIIMYLLFILGTFAVGWAFIIAAIGSEGEAALILPRYIKGMYSFAFFCLLASLAMVIIHLLAG
ncbi:MAG: hypothetical protein JJE15_09520 [Desulfobacteraceae bacterium]|nr:hypothetical protein [Desulfobacteraceae bacterium]